MIRIYMTIVKSLLGIWLFIILISFIMGNTIIVQEPDIVDALNTVVNDTTIEKWVHIRDKKVIHVSEKVVTISWNFTIIPDSSSTFSKLKRVIE